MSGFPGLTLLAAEFTVHRLAADAALPAAIVDTCPVFIARSSSELSLACPSTLQIVSDRAESGWRCLAVDGPLDFSLTGILAALSGSLARRQISLFAVSTFDTDYLLVRKGDLATAIAALCEDGYRIVE